MIEELGLLRAREDLLGVRADNGIGKVLAYSGKSGHYYRIPRDAADFLSLVAEAPQGMVVREARDLFPSVDFQRMVNYGLVDYLPVDGLPIAPSLVLELAARNFWAQTLLRTTGWEAVDRYLHRGTASSGRSPSVRPVFFDTMESACRVAFALPGTSRECTVVALSLRAALGARGYSARIILRGTINVAMFHAEVVVGDHTIDPGDVAVDAPRLTEFF